MIHKLLFVMLFAAASAYAQQSHEEDFQTLHVLGAIYMIAGAGGTITVSVGLDGVLLVDSGSAAMTDKVIAEIRRLQVETGRRYEETLRYGAETRSTLNSEQAAPAPPKPIRFIINTTDDPDHYGGNEKISKLGRTIKIGRAHV